MPRIMTLHRIAIAVIAFSALASGCESSPDAHAPPRVGGQEVPRQAISIDFAKRFDVHARFANEAMDFKNCKIVGFVEGENAASIGSWNPSSGSHSFSRGWLVIEKPDGRRSYIPESSIVFFEDAAP